jgi:hypothetical protein
MRVDCTMLPELPLHIVKIIERYLESEFWTLCRLRESCSQMGKHIQCPDYTRSNDWLTFITCIEKLCCFHFDCHAKNNIPIPIDVVRQYHLSEGHELMSTVAEIFEDMPSNARLLAFRMFSDVLIVTCEHLRPCMESYIHFRSTLHCLECQADTKTCLINKI